MSDKEETNPLLNNEKGGTAATADIESNNNNNNDNIDDITKPNTNNTIYNQNTPFCKLMWILLFLTCMISQVIGYVYYERTEETMVIRTEQGDGKKIATDEAGTRDTIAFWQVLPYTTYAPATILIIFGLIVTFSKQSAMCMGTTWHSSRHQVCVTCVCLLFVPLLTAYTSVYLSGELDDYYIVKAGGFQKNINPQVPLPDPKANVGTLEFTTYTFLDIKRGASFEGKSNGKPYVGCAFPIVQGTKEKDGTLTSKQNSVTYWSSSCATTSTCCKKYYESKGSDICDHWMKLSSTKLYENKTYGMIQPSLPCPTKGPMNAVVSLHKVQYPELSYSLEITGDYLATQNGHLFKGTLIMLIPILVLSLIQIIGLFVQQYINIAIWSAFMMIWQQKEDEEY